MDEEITVINSNTRNEKIKNFFISNKKKIITFLSLIVLILISFFAYGEFKKKEDNKISDLYNVTIIEYSEQNKVQTLEKLKTIINKRHPTYSPLSLYFIIENNLISEKREVNDLFDVLIKKTSLEEEIKNLIIYKKGLYNADTVSEDKLLEILKPLINSNSVWKSHALYLAAEYFFSKNEKQKSKEFFNQILTISNVNQEILQETQKRLNRDLSD
tara:strand:- start:6531 stop:7175 length:645 start_codon:yes stop_codon:yes gene_type:complete